MQESQTIISIKREKVSYLRNLNRHIPNFFRDFMRIHSVSGYPGYVMEDSIFISTSEFENLNTCNLITPLMGATLTNIIHKSFEDTEKGKGAGANYLEDPDFFPKEKIIENLVMGYKGVFVVDDLDKLEIQADFANSKNSVYSIFGLRDSSFGEVTAEDFEKILDIVEYRDKDNHPEIGVIKNIKEKIHYLGSFAQRQAALVYQSDGVFKAYPFKSNKGINLDLDQILEDYKEEAYRLNHRFEFADKQKKLLLLMKYVPTYNFREKLSGDLFEAFILGLKGNPIRINNEKQKEEVIQEEETEDNDDDL